MAGSPTLNKLETMLLGRGTKADPKSMKKGPGKSPTMPPDDNDGDECLRNKQGKRLFMKGGKR